MTIGNEDLLALVTKIVSPDPEVREEGADICSDWSSVLDQHESDLVVRVLSMAAIAEDDREIRETQLHALLRIDEHGKLKRTLLSPLCRLFAADLDDEQLDYLEALDVYPASDSED